MCVSTCYTMTDQSDYSKRLTYQPDLITYQPTSDLHVFYNVIYTAHQFEYYFLEPQTMDKHTVPTLAGFSRETTVASFSLIFAQIKVYPVVPQPLQLVRMLLRLSTHSRLGEGLAMFRSAATSVCSSNVRGSKISN